MAKKPITRTDGNGTCEECGRDFPYYLVHNGFNDSAYAYCEDCGQTALLAAEHMPRELIKDLQSTNWDTHAPGSTNASAAAA